jgi:hypothetical protein
MSTIQDEYQLCWYSFALASHTVNIALHAITLYAHLAHACEVRAACHLTPIMSVIRHSVCSIVCIHVCNCI